MQSVSVSERREPERTPENLEDGLERHLAARQDSALPHLIDLRSTYATRLSAGGVADEWVTQLLRQGDAKVLQMKREALVKLNRMANEQNSVENSGYDTARVS